MSRLLNYFTHIHSPPSQIPPPKPSVGPSYSPYNWWWRRLWGGSTTAVEGLPAPRRFKLHLKTHLLTLAGGWFEYSICTLWHFVCDKCNINKHHLLTYLMDRTKIYEKSLQFKVMGRFLNPWWGPGSLQRLTIYDYDQCIASSVQEATQEIDGRGRGQDYFSFWAHLKEQWVTIRGI